MSDVPMKLFEWINKEARRREDEAYLGETPRAELVADLRAMGVESRHVMVHSSYKAIRPVAGGPAGVVDAFVEAVGDGVLLFPTFDFESWSERGYWDRQCSPSRMGIISETARLDERFTRSLHPMLSYAIYHGLPFGRSMIDPPGYMDDVPNAHGAGSAFDRFVQRDGLLLSFSGEGFRPRDIGYTISNHCAVLAEAPWRFTKVFEGTYVDDGWATSIRKYSASVCRRDRFITEVSPAHDEAERLGVITRHKLGRATCLRAEANVFLEWAVESHRKSPELWRREI